MLVERRQMLGLLIGFTLCLSIWRITMQESSMPETLNGYIGLQYQHQQPQETQLHHYTVKSSDLLVTNSRIITTKTTTTTTITTITTTKGNIQENGYNYNNSGRNNYNFNRTSRKMYTNTNILDLQRSSIETSQYILPSPISSYKNYYYGELPKDDLSNLIDLHDFRFLINQLPCRTNANNILRTYDRTKNNENVNNDYNGNNNEEGYNVFRFKTDYTNENTQQQNQQEYNGILVLILIHSAPNNYKKRLHIRETWGSLETPLIRLIFLLGTVNDTNLQRKIELENNMFSDIVQGNFIDAYRNMTYKHVMALKWFTYYCPNAKFLLKVDDDVFVNTPYLIDYLNRYAKRSNLLFCSIVYWSRVKRSYRSKWRVSTKEYSGRYYPPYCPGYSVMYSSDIAYRLYREAQRTSYFWIDDVHITGTLAQKSNITITSSSSYILTKGLCEKILNTKDLSNNLINNNIKNNNNSQISLENFLFLFSWPDIEEQQAKNLWKIIENLR